MGAIGSLVGGVVGGLLGGNGPDPHFKKANLSAEGQAGLDDITARGNASVDDTAALSNEGVESGGQLLQPADQQKREMTSLGMSDPGAMSQALSSRAERNFGSDVAKIKRQGQIGALDRRNKFQAAAFDLNNQKKMIEQEYQVKQRVYQRQLESAKNQVLSDLISSAGALAGASIAQASGPASGGAAGAGGAGGAAASTGVTSGPLTMLAGI